MGQSQNQYYKTHIVLKEEIDILKTLKQKLRLRMCANHLIIGWAPFPCFWNIYHKSI
jgi:hypothetical protein